MPQYTAAQIHAYYQQYGCYPAGYQPPQQTPVANSAYAYPQGNPYAQVSSASHEYGYGTPLATASGAARYVNECLMKTDTVHLA